MQTPPDNRSNLLGCALHLFATRGYEAVGVQEIVEAAGVTKPTLYHYFGSKLGLLDALCKEHFEPFIAQVSQGAAFHGDLPLTLSVLVITYFDFARKHREFYRLHLSLWLAPAESEAAQLVAAYLDKLYRPVEEMFVQAALKHGNMRGRHRQYAASLVGLINTYIGLALNDHLELDNDLVIKVVHQFSHGIYS